MKLNNIKNGIIFRQLENDAYIKYNSLQNIMFEHREYVGRKFFNIDNISKVTKYESSVVNFSIICCLAHLDNINFYNDFDEQEYKPEFIQYLYEYRKSICLNNITDEFLKTIFEFYNNYSGKLNGQIKYLNKLIEYFCNEYIKAKFYNLKNLDTFKHQFESALFCVYHYIAIYNKLQNYMYIHTKNNKEKYQIIKQTFFNIFKKQTEVITHS